MVVWKNNTENSDTGYKALNLDKVEGFNVPNFYAITRKETQKATNNSTNPREILNNKLQPEILENWENAFKELGMSNEVRNSNGKARNLVTGQRNNVKASVRISEQPGQVFKKQLNTTTQDLEKTIKQLLANYHSNKDEDAPQNPSIIVQKMIEPEYTIATTLNYRGSSHLIEAVPGLGTTLEKAKTKPEIHLINRENDQIQSRIPKTQTKEEKHPVKGTNRTKQINRDKPALNESEIKKIIGKLENQGYSAKFIYKRGTFYLVDAKKAEETNPFTEGQQKTTGIRASEGEIKGRTGQQIQIKETTQKLPQNKALILKKGSYQSDIAQKARKNQIPLIVNYNQEHREGEKLNFGKKQITNQNNSEENQQQETKNRKDALRQSRREKIPNKRQNNNKQQGNEEINVIASETLPLNTENGLTLTPPHINSRYAISNSTTQAKNTINEKNYITTYGEAFQKGKTKAETKILDTRKLNSQEGLKQALKYIEAKEKILITNQINKQTLYQAIQAGYTKFATTQHKIPELQQKLAETEQKYIINTLREIEGK